MCIDFEKIAHVCCCSYLTRHSELAKNLVLNSRKILQAKAIRMTLLISFSMYFNWDMYCTLHLLYGLLDLEWD